MGRPLKAVCSLAAVLMPALLGGCGQGATGEPSASPTKPPETLAMTSAHGASQLLVARGMVLDDGRVLTEAEAAAVLPQPVNETSFDSPCPEPSGGWRAPDPERATLEAQDRAFETAEELSDYAGSWIDDRGDANQDPLKIIVNAQVTGDVAVAERAIRRVWGGSLCISQVAHTEAELREILDRLAERSDSQLVEIGSNPVELSVHDDGSPQRELNSTFGKGLVRDRSLLRPYTG